MKQFLIDLTDIKANPMSYEFQYEVGDVISIEMYCELFGNYIINKKVVKITENKYNKYKFIFVEHLSENDYEEMTYDEITRLIENPNA
jgi:hypothetical protein